MVKAVCLLLVYCTVSQEPISVYLTYGDIHTLIIFTNNGEKYEILVIVEVECNILID